MAKISITQLSFFDKIDAPPPPLKYIPRHLRRFKPLPKHSACTRCGETRSLETHHIQALVDGGANTLENTTTLCIVCHKEWHMIEIRTTITFEQWMRLPSYEELLALFMAQWPDNLSQSEIKQGVIQSRELIRSFRELTNNDEPD